MSTGTTPPTTAKEYVVRPTEAPAVEHGAIKATIEEITPELAELYLEALEYGGQRKVRQHHVERLAREMERGTFRPGTLIEIMQFDEKEYLINGQHRLHAVAQSKTTQTFTVQTTRAASMEDIAFAYGRTDIGMKRTNNDLYGALDLAKKLHLPTDRAVTDLSAAVKYMLTGCAADRSNTYPNTPPEEIIDYMAIYAPYMVSYMNIAVNCEQRMRTGVYRAATLAVAMLTLRFAAPYAADHGYPTVEDFWRQAIFDDGLAATDPRKFANRHLRDTTMSSARRGETNRVFVTAGRSSRYLASCFRSYMDRRQIHLVKVLDETAPIAMHGIPSDHSKWW